jgi:hypothetical protein
MLTFLFFSLSLSLDCRKIAPTLLLDVPQDSAIMTGEIFGPLLPIVTVSDISPPAFFMEQSAVRILCMEQFV